jgi:thiamine-monophosphate kinase
LMTAWPKGMTLAAKTQFVAGLRRDQDYFKLSLFGGDTVSTPGPLTLCATVFGHVPSGRTLSRAGAGEGEALLVSGPVGDGYLGLKVLQGELAALSEADRQALIEAYRRPMPRLDVAALVLKHATASMDVSDGLIADARHMAKASGVDMHIALDRVPVSGRCRWGLSRWNWSPAAMTIRFCVPPAERMCRRLWPQALYRSANACAA